MRVACGAALAGALLAVLVGGAAPAAAHVSKRSGSFEVELGWAQEPPHADGQNAVELIVSDLSGAPVAVPAGALSVAVVYDGDSVTLPLVPTEDPGTLEAPLTPTRPGTYSFRVSGRVHGQQLDVSATCSASTFECVEDSAGPEFPVKDPSAGQLAQRLQSESGRVRRADERADDAQTLAIVALAVGALALGLAAIAVAVALARRRRGEE
jgi:hypothetical protein